MTEEILVGNCRTKTVAIHLQLFYYINEMENNYIKRENVEYKILKDKVISAARKEITSNTEMNDSKAMEIISDLAFTFPESESVPISDMETLIYSIFLRIRKNMSILTPLIEDEDVTEIMVNNHKEIFFEKYGNMNRYNMTFDSDEELEEIMQNVAAQVHREINELNPIVDARLTDGSRVNGVYKNIAINGPTMTIRKFSRQYMKMEDLINNGTLTDEAAELLRYFVKRKYNIFVSGGTSSGKTTLLNALGEFIGKDERIIVIEDSAELQLNYIDNIVQMECRQANSSGKGKVNMSELIKASLRMRPDRIIVGEVRGKEVLDMIQAMNTGHSGSMSTGHGNSIDGMLKRLETMYLMAVSMDIEAIRAQIAEAIDIMVHIERRGKKRQIVEISKLNGYDRGKFRICRIMYMKNERLIAVDNAEKYINDVRGKDGLQNMELDSL